MALTKINHRSVSGQVTNAQMPTDMTSNFPTGAVLQTQIGRINNTVATASATSFQATGLFVDITLTAASNMVKLHFDAKTAFNTSSSYAGANWGIYRKIGSGAMSSWKMGGGWDHYLNRTSYAHDFYPHLSYYFTDSPNTTSVLRYEIYVKMYGASTQAQQYFPDNVSTIPSAGYAPGMPANALIDRGLLIAEEIKV